MKNGLRTITLEEHFVTTGFLKATGAFGLSAPEGLQKMREKLLEVDEDRLEAMDEAGIDMQVLSLAALSIDSLDGPTGTAVLHDVNDELAELVRDYPDRFAGFASVQLKEPENALKELERCVKTLGFKGLMVDGTTGGKFLDAPEFLPVLEAAMELGVPVYLHPAEPPKTVQEAYFSGLPGEAGHLLSIAGWGWHAENGLHALRMIAGGVLERLPELQVIIGHMGEGVPYALARSSAVLSSALKMPLTVAEYFHRNFHVTTSGYFTKPPFACALEVVGIDRMMYSVDYPFSPNTKGKEFLNSLELGEGEMEKFVGGNAARLLKL